MHRRAIALVALLAAACSSPQTAPSAGTAAPQSTSPAATSLPATAAGSAAPSAGTVTLPGDITLEDIGGNAPVSGTAGFTLQGSDVAVSLELAGTDQLLPFPDTVSVFVVPGTCAEQTPTPNVTNAVATASVDIENGVATEPLVVGLAAITTGPHALLVTTAPGDVSLACGAIG